MTPATHFLPHGYTGAMASPERQALIKAVYEDPETGFGSIRDTFLQAHEKDPGIRYIDVKTFLDKLAHRQTQFRYQGHNSRISPHKLAHRSTSST